MSLQKWLWFYANLGMNSGSTMYQLLALTQHLVKLQENGGSNAWLNELTYKLYLKQVTE
jgi:hypothetical protein